MADNDLLEEFEKLRVLVVDDEEDMRDLVQDILRDLGIVRVHLAEDGESAWRRLRRTELEYDLIISDWLMPHMDGLQLLKNMRQWGSETPFMMLTVKVTGEAVSAAVEAGVTLYLAKPFTYGDFRSKVTALAKQIVENKVAA